MSTFSLTSILASLVMVLLCTIFILLWYLGAFSPIIFRKGTLAPGMTFLYQNHQGPYSDCGPKFEATLAFLAKHTILKDFNLAGIYYDDPKTTDTPRYSVGFMLNEKAMEQWKNIPTEETKRWHTMPIKETSTIISSFPMRWNAPSCALSAMKTYPAFEKRKDFELKCGSVEIYYDDIIETHFPQENINQFQPKFGSLKKTD